jgi:hypothetical protein
VPGSRVPARRAPDLDRTINFLHCPARRVAGQIAGEGAGGPAREFGIKFNVLLRS